MQSSGNKTQTNFRKKTESHRIPGTRISYYNAQLLTSTGISSLDSHLGGGLPVGTVLLVEEDKYSTYAHLLLKYFVAEGVTNGHSVFLATGDVDPEKVLSELPAVATIEQKIQHSIPDDQLKIAWRYKGQNHTPENSAAFGHTYDLSKTILPEQLKNSNITSWNVSADHLNKANEDRFISEPYSSLLFQVQETIANQQFKTSEKNCNSVFRIAIGSLGSPLWETNDNSSQLKAIPRFLYALRSLLRSSYSVALVTLKAKLLDDCKLISRLRQMSDFVVKLESFVGTTKSQNAMLKDFDGLLHILKLPCLNTFTYQIPTSDLAFKLKRKNFQIERLHLPPDIEEPSEDAVSFGCGSHSKLLDF